MICRVSLYVDKCMVIVVELLFVKQSILQLYYIKFINITYYLIILYYITYFILLLFTIYLKVAISNIYVATILL